ncbi:MAG: hypothetical protein ABI353_05440, partial [Isosphaeraceae bacterium]
MFSPTSQRMFGGRSGAAGFDCAWAAPPSRNSPNNTAKKAIIATPDVRMALEGTIRVNAIAGRGPAATHPLELPRVSWK